MTVFGAVTRLLLLLMVGLSLGGCFPVGESPADEEKDPYFLAGKGRMNSMDFDGAVISFENALASNPKSAAAHLELGLLYEEKKGDYAAAIYHLERHLQLRPDSNMAEAIKQRVLACKLELAKTVSFALVSRQVQDEIRKLSATNTDLHEQIDQLKQQMAEQALAWSNKLAFTIASQAAALSAAGSSASEPERKPPASERTPSPSAVRPAVRPAGVPRTHIVKPGETLATISRKYNIKLSALQNANPTVDARRLKAGQTLLLPALKN